MSTFGHRKSGIGYPKSLLRCESVYTEYSNYRKYIEHLSS